MKKAILFILFCLLAIALLPELSAIFKNSRRPYQSVDKTEIIKYSQKYTPGVTKSGSCWIQSIAASSNDKAWRCFADGNYIYDPCFETEAKQLVCDVTPEKPEGGFVLSLSKSLPDRRQNNLTEEAKWPWIVKLQNGLICTKITGAAHMIEGEYVYYSCSSGDAFILGKVDSATEPWKAKVAYTSKDYKQVYKSEIVSIVKVWE